MGEAELDLEDLERLGRPPILSAGSRRQSMPGSCHRQGLRVGDIARAAGFALLSDLVLLNKGELPVAAGGPAGGTAA
jgi:hypothetical protein